MANTYSQIYIQIVFSVQNRETLLKMPWRLEVYKYISGIIKNKGIKPIISNGMEDHIHILIELKPESSLSDLVRDIKKHSTIFINKQNWLSYKFSWQSGFGAFSYSYSQVDKVYNYIKNQDKIHLNSTFQKEYTEFLNKFNVEYRYEFLFKWID